MPQHAKSGPLSNISVIEMAGIGPCPLAGQFLADMGASVTVIERKSGGARPHDVTNRSKRSVALNLKSPEAIEAMMKLVERADVLIEGFRPGVMERLGLGPDDCAARNPRLVYGRMTGWGQEGPLSQTAGHDLNYLSLTGALWMMGAKDRPPTPPLNLVADYGGGTMFLIFGVLAALIERETSGKGQTIDAAMIDGATALTSTFFGRRAAGLWADARESNLLDGGAPFYRCYETADGGYVSLAALEPQFFAEFVKLSGADIDPADQYKVENWPDYHRLLTDLFKTKTRDAWAAVFEGSDACVAPVLSPPEAAAHPHNTVRTARVEVEGVVQPAPAPRLDRTPAGAAKAPPAAGADTDAVLAELGYSAEEIAAMRQLGAAT